MVVDLCAFFLLVAWVLVVIAVVVVVEPMMETLIAFATLPSMDATLLS